MHSTVMPFNLHQDLEVRILSETGSQVTDATQHQIRVCYQSALQRTLPREGEEYSSESHHDLGVSFRSVNKFQGLRIQLKLDTERMVTLPKATGVDPLERWD